MTCEFWFISSGSATCGKREFGSFLPDDDHFADGILGLSTIECTSTPCSGLLSHPSNGGAVIEMTSMGFRLQFLASGFCELWYELGKERKSSVSSTSGEPLSSAPPVLFPLTFSTRASDTNNARETSGEAFVRHTDSS